MKKVFKVKKNFRYNVINRLGIPEPFTGTFKNRESATKWYKVHGIFFEKLGYVLKLAMSEIVIK
jgi:hypothetical protein